MSATLAIAVVLATAAIAVLVIEAGRGRRAQSQLGPREWPLIGALLWVLQNGDRLLDQALVEFTSFGFHVTWSAKWLGSARHHFTANPAIVEHVLKSNFATYVKGPIFAANLGVLLGSGIFASDGDKWQAQRKLISHMFSAREFRETISESLARHAQQLDALLLAAGSAPGQVVDFQALFFRFTLDTIGEVAFGDHIGALTDPAVPFSAAFDEAQLICEHRFVSPGWRVLEHLDGSARRLSAAIRVLNDYCAELIARRRALSNSMQRRDLLSRVMNLHPGDAGADLVAAGGDAFLRDFVLNALIAGRDTTGQACAWAVWEVARSPRRLEFEEMLAREATKVLGPVGIDVQPVGEDGSDAPREESVAWHDRVTRELRYAHAVVHETLRLHPSVPKNVMGRSVAVWGPDAAEFKPERWLKLPIKPSPFVYPVFNAGPRTCPGQAMALLEASIVLSTVYRRCSLELSPASQATDMPPQESLTLPQRHGVRCEVKLRDTMNNL